MATPTLGSVSPTSYTADNNQHSMYLYGGNFISGDTLTFIDPQNQTFADESATYVSGSELETSFNSGDDPGTWYVEVNSASGSSGEIAFTVAGSDINGIDSTQDFTLVTQAANLHAQGNDFFGAYIGPERSFNSTEAKEFEAAGMVIVSIHERTDQNQQYTLADADDDALNAIKSAYNAGQPLNEGAIYFGLETENGTAPPDTTVAAYAKQIGADFENPVFVAQALGVAEADP